MSVNRQPGTYFGPVGQIDVTDPLARGLVGWWPMTDVATKTIIDISGRGNHCIMQTGTAVALGTPWGHGVNFGATANSFGYASAIPGMGSNPYTMSIWARNISQGTSLIMFAFNSNQYMGNIFGGAGNNNWGCAYANGYAQDSGVTSLDQEWHHVVTTVDGASGTGRIYVDGLLRASKAVGLSDGNSNVVIGGWLTGGFNAWNGGLRDARIYNRALSAAEVMALYQQPSRPMVQPRLFMFSGSVSATLTGEAATYTPGTLTPTRTAALTGTEATYSAGTPTAAVSVALTGASATYSAGTITPPQPATVALTGEAATYQAGTLTAQVSSDIDPFAADEYRKSLRNLAKIAEERRRAKVEEAREIRQEILAALGEAKPLDGTEIKSAVRAVASAVPGRDPEKVTEAQLSRVTDWAPIYEAVADLRRAIEYERMLEQDDEEVLLLI